jgi:hypothetical protein
MNEFNLIQWVFVFLFDWSAFTRFKVQLLTISWFLNCKEIKYSTLPRLLNCSKSEWNLFKKETTVTHMKVILKYTHNSVVI